MRVHRKLRALVFNGSLWAPICSFFLRSSRNHYWARKLIIDLELINDSQLAFFGEYATAGKNCLRRIRVLPGVSDCTDLLYQHRSCASWRLQLTFFKSLLFFLYRLAKSAEGGTLPYTYEAVSFIFVAPSYT